MTSRHDPLHRRSERLLEWVEAAVPRSQAMLQALPLHLRLAKPVMAMLVSAALTAILLQIPARHAAAKWHEPVGTPVSQTERDVPVTTAPGDSPAAEAPDPNSGCTKPPRASTRRSAHR